MSHSSCNKLALLVLLFCFLFISSNGRKNNLVEYDDVADTLIVANVSMDSVSGFSVETSVEWLSNILPTNVTLDGTVNYQLLLPGSQYSFVTNSQLPSGWVISLQGHITGSTSASLGVQQMMVTVYDPMTNTIFDATHSIEILEPCDPDPTAAAGIMQTISGSSSNSALNNNQIQVTKIITPYTVGRVLTHLGADMHNIVEAETHCKFVLYEDSDESGTPDYLRGYTEEVVFTPSFPGWQYYPMVQPFEIQPSTKDLWMGAWCDVDLPVYTFADASGTGPCLGDSETYWDTIPPSLYVTDFTYSGYDFNFAVKYWDSEDDFVCL